MFWFFVIIFYLLTQIKCDTPANCTYDDVRGLWKFTVSTAKSDTPILTDLNSSKGIVYYFISYLDYSTLV